MSYYAPPTGTPTNNAIMRAAGLRFLVSPLTERMHVVGAPYALDNGAWTAFTQGTAFDFEAFERMVARLGCGADWLVVPDVVGDPQATRELAALWVPRLRGACGRLLVAAQDGMTIDDVPPGCGVAIGGSTAWKDATLEDQRWRRAPYLHVLRCNTRRRIQAARRLGADSVDGTSPTRFPRANSERVARWVAEAAQLELWSTA